MIDHVGIQRWFHGLTVALVTACSANSAIVESGFREEVWQNSVVSSATGLAWAPDGSGRLLVLGKEGAVRIVKQGALLPTPFATVSPLYTGSECGLIGICFDPNFLSNRFVYVFATVSSSEQQIIRYTANGDIGGNKTVVVPGLPTKGANHDGGGIGIGPDGRIYWAIGDQGDGTGVDGNLATLASKVGRANLNGTVPADNPFVDGGGANNDYIWARGFRNPFTLTFQPATGELWVNCVGAGYEQIFLVRRGDHAGWNNYENNQPPGYIRPKIKYRTNGTDTRSIDVNGANRTGGVTTFTTTSAHGFRKGEKISISGVADGSFNGSFYVTSAPSDTTFTISQAAGNANSGGGSATTLDQGGSVTGGTFYESTRFPAAYRGNFFFGDFNSHRVMRATFDGANEVATVDYFATGFGSMIDAAVGPDGALYFLNYGGEIRRVTLTDSPAGLIVTPTVLYVTEGGAGVIDVSLGAAPQSTVNVTASIVSGASIFSVAAGTAPSFHSGNFSATQPIVVASARDAGLERDQGIVRIQASGYSPVDVTIKQIDVVDGLRFVSVRRLGNGAVELTLEGPVGQQVTVEGSENLATWQPVQTLTFSSSAMTISDPNASLFNRRFYRARTAP